MVRTDKMITPSVTQKLQELGYNVAEWDNSNTLAPDTVQKVLKTASKKGNGAPGYADRLYVNDSLELIVIVEEKGDIRQHDGDDVIKHAVPGAKWYLSRFLNKNLNSSLKDRFNTWKIIGIAVSGDLTTEFANKFSAFYIDMEEQNIKFIPQLQNFVTDDEYIAIFNNLDEEKAISQVSASSKRINNLLRSIDSQKRPVLLSALMISLYIPKDKDGNIKKINNDFVKFYRQYSSQSIVDNLTARVKNVLEAEGIPSQKIVSLDSELSFLKTDPLLSTQGILKDILLELDESVIPLFNSSFSTNSNYDIIGKFYEEFLRYAGVSNVKKGIVLTPRHITTLFTKLIPIKSNDIIVDLASGTGAFLIAGMNSIINQINASQTSERDKKIQSLKENQLLGFEVNPTMYISSISNMLFRNDGKSAIYNLDSINDERAQKLLDEFKPTVGFINPPYSGKENKTDLTPKEITFIRKMLDNVSRYGIVIAPISTFFKDITIRQQILQAHTLKYVINMPGDLFAPNAASHTSIAVFETNRPHNYDQDEVVFYDLDDDGFVLTKNKGRTDVYGKWSKIEKELLDAVVNNKIAPDGITLLKKAIKKTDEWTVQQHLEVDYSTLNYKNFIDTIANFVMFSAKRNLNILTDKISDFNLYQTINEYFDGKLNSEISKDTSININISSWKEFALTGIESLFPNYDNGTRLVEAERIDGTYPFLTAGEYNQGFVQSIGNYTSEELTPPSITIDMFFNVFYQDYSFASDDNVYHFNNSNLNPYNSLFIVTILEMQKSKYGYGRQFRKKNASETKLLLPTTTDGKPDYAYMTEFIKSLPYADVLSKELEASKMPEESIIN